MKLDKLKFYIGDRVKLSKEGIDGKIYKYNFIRHGTVIGFSRENYPRVRWDGHSINTIYDYHPTFLERINPKGNGGQ